ncbi:hypothetical protein BR93DRAFT_972682 [Coniochaeta sp. PMI_546]|nr:hypothetical protein BR93DRAFT_972682 [Coniochaeta sp. PMI_546]
MPAIYRLAFQWYEPISCLIGFWINTFNLGLGLRILVPGCISARDPAHDVLSNLLGGAMFCFAVLQGALLRYTDDTNVWKIVNGGFLSWDICLLYGSYTMLVSQGRLYPSSWRLEDWSSMGLTASVGLLRALFVLGVGLSGTSTKSTRAVSIYSHAAGALLFIVLHVYFFASEGTRRYRLASCGDMVVMSIYFVSVTISFMSSAAEKALKLGNKLDFQGLVAMIWAASVALVYYAFICDIDLQVRYWTLASTAAAFCSFFNVQPRFSKPHLQVFRALSLGWLAISFFVPVIHSLAAYGLSIQTRRLALHWIVYSLICHTFCAATYAIEFPERFFPRTYDLFGASHQIFHIMLLAGAITYTYALSQQFDFLHGTATTCAIL